MTVNVKPIFEQFDVAGEFISGEPYGSGHINDTYLVSTTPPAEKNYILQRVNHLIFKNVPKLMENIVRVTEHIRQKITEEGGDPDRQTLTVMRTKDGGPFYVDPDGNFWRMYIFIDKNKSYDIVESAQQAFEGGKAFGQFQKYLSDLPGGPLFETIPDFHNIDSRMKLFEAAKSADTHDRVKEVQSEIDFVMNSLEDMRVVLKLGQAGKIPLRVTHNDTKFNNVLLDESDHGLCVIDLDTVMPGYIHYDFSDTIRTATNTAAEDEADLGKIDMNVELFEAYVKGFIGEVGEKLNDAEWTSLPLAAKLLPFTIGLRFLTDYLDGDNYFKTHFEGHNLQRARAQFELTRKVWAKEAHIAEFIAGLR